MAGNYLNELIDPCARYGSSYQEEWNVSHIQDIGRSENSRLYSPYPQLRYELNFSNGNLEGLAKKVSKLYQRCYGTYRYFRVRHYAEFTTNDRTKPPTANDQLLLRANTPPDQFIYQLVTWYDLPSAMAPRRLITKPIEASVKVAVNGEEVSSALYYVEPLNGTITFISDPGGTVSAGCEFHIPMRFDAAYSGTFNNLNVLSSSVSLVEVLDGDWTF